SETSFGTIASTSGSRLDRCINHPEGDDTKAINAQAIDGEASRIKAVTDHQAFFPKPSVVKPQLSSSSISAQNGRSTPQPGSSSDTPSSKSQKRPRPDKVPGVDDASPVLKKAKLNARPDGTIPKRRRMFRFKHPKLKEVMRKLGVKSQMPPPRDPSHVKTHKSASPFSVRPSPAASPAPAPSESSIMAKPARKPLPTGSSGGGGSSGPAASPPPSVASLPPKPPSQASPPPPEGQPASKRVKLVIKRPSTSAPKN
ncbi:Transcription initiation factor TFIID subunit 2, partial [Colletotrichum tropicale]